MSQPLIDFVTQHLNVHTMPKPKPTLSKKSATTLYQIYGQIVKGFVSWTRAYPTIQRNQIPLHQIVYDQSIAQSVHDLIPPTIRKTLETSPKWRQQFKFTIHKRTFFVDLMHPIQDASWTKSKTARYFASAIQKIYVWLFVASQYADADCSRALHVYVYFTDHTKILAKTKLEPLDTIHVNTAFTTVCAPTGTITIFRKEEWFKVFLHEVMHNMGLDFSHVSAEIHRGCNEMIWKLFPVRSDVRLFETYCETWAEIVNVLWIAMSKTRDKSDWPTILRKVETYLHYETLWSVFQCAKVMDHYHLTYRDMVIKSSKPAKAATQYREKSYILAYYVIKAILMVHVNAFLEWNADHNRVLNFTKSWPTVSAFCHFVGKYYQSPEFLQIVGEMERRFADMSMADELVRTTMRMTVFG